MQGELAGVASLFGEPARAAIILRLMSGSALPAGELAVAANISPQTASGHLARLVEGKLLSVERNGRHRFYRLAATEVADAVEALVTLSIGSRKAEARQPSPPALGTIAHARTCYAHLAGWLGVRVIDALRANGHLEAGGGRRITVTESGALWFQSIGVDLPTRVQQADPRFARSCLDWTERRPHLAGAVGIAMYRRFVGLRWVIPRRDTRALRITLEGRRELWNLLRIPIG